MSLVLEQIIRQVLLEQQPVSKIKRISDKEWSEAKSAGAIHAYVVKVKRTTDPNLIRDLVIGITKTSKGEDTEDKIAVGDTSKYATDDYVYVMSDPDISRKNQKVLVYILPNPFKDFLRKGKKINNIDVVLTSSGKIGNALLMTQEQYNNNLITAELPEQDIQINVVKTSSTPEVSIEPSLTSVTTSSDDLESETKTITYPTSWETIEDGVVNVYTLTDPTIVYLLYNNGSWWQAKKSEFENSYNSGAPLTSSKVKDAMLLQQLNKLIGKSSQPDKLSKSQKNKKEIPVVPTEKKKERIFKANEKIKLNSTNVYSYNVTNNVFKKIGKYTPANDVIEYRRKSSDKKYVQVYFVKDKQLVWVPIDSIK